MQLRSALYAILVMIGMGMVLVLTYWLSLLFLPLIILTIVGSIVFLLTSVGKKPAQPPDDSPIIWYKSSIPP